MKHFYLDSILSSQSVTVFLWNCKKTNFKSGLKNQNTYWIQYPCLATANPEYDTACNSYAIIWDGVKMHLRPMGFILIILLRSIFFVSQIIIC